MRYVIVITGHREQFKAFVKTVLAKGIFVHYYPDSVVIEGVMFKHVTRGVQLRGYELEQSAITDIEEQFHARCKK